MHSYSNAYSNRSMAGLAGLLIDGPSSAMLSGVLQSPWGDLIRLHVPPLTGTLMIPWLLAASTYLGRATHTTRTKGRMIQCNVPLLFARRCLASRQDNVKSLPQSPGIAGRKYRPISENHSTFSVLSRASTTRGGAGMPVVSTQ